jgi:DNA repair exonuclease SbcCD ATPase subunit
MVHFDSLLIPNSIQPDNLRQMMRKVEDDIISRMALLQSFRTSLSESTAASEDAQSIAAELVSLIQRVSDLEQSLRDCESDLTEAQAREAIIEADRNSVRVLLNKTTQALEKEQQSVNKLNTEIESCQRNVQTLQDQLAISNRDLDDIQTQLVDYQNEPPRSADPTLPTLLLTKESLLRRSREALEDWSIVSRLTLEHLSSHFKGWARLQPFSNVSKSFDISFEELLQTDPDSFPDEMDSFLSSVSFLIKQTYNKVTLANQSSPLALSKSLEDTMMKLKSESAQRISFYS